MLTKGCSRMGKDVSNFFYKILYSFIILIWCNKNKFNCFMFFVFLDFFPFQVLAILFNLN